MHSPALSGIGIDIVEISRIARAMEDASFVSLVLGPTEIRADCTASWLAGRWAAKEAIAKAVGVSLRWHDVEIREDDRGRPVVSILSDPASSVQLAISVGGGLACAFAIAESEPLAEGHPRVK